MESLINGRGGLLKGRRPLEFIPFIALLVVFGWHFLYVSRSAVDIPFWDEWDVWWTWEGASFGDWLFQRHNEHRIVFTRLQILLLEGLGSGDIALLQKLNFGIFALVVAWFPWIGAKTSALSAATLSAFSLFLLSPLNHENHAWAFQSQFHFSVLFVLASATLAFRDKPTAASFFLAVLFALGSAFSLSAGLAAAAALGVVMGLYSYSRGTLRKAVLPLILLVLGLGLCLRGHHHLPGHPELVLPSSAKFWSFLFNLVALGFGYNKLASGWGVFCVALVFFPLVAHALTNRERLSRSYWSSLAVTLAVMAALATISMGRGGWGAAGSKSSRYSEFSLLLIPLSAMAWGIYLQERPSLKRWFLGGLWVFCFFNFINDWNMNRYAELREQREQGESCVRDYYLHNGNAECPTLYPVSLKSRLERAKATRASMYRKLTEEGL